MEAIKIKKEKFDDFYDLVRDYIQDIDNSKEDTQFSKVMDLARECVGEFKFWEGQALFQFVYLAIRVNSLGDKKKSAINALSELGIIVEV